MTNELKPCPICGGRPATIAAAGQVGCCRVYTFPEVWNRIPRPSDFDPVKCKCGKMPTMFKNGIGWRISCVDLECPINAVKSPTLPEALAAWRELVTPKEPEWKYYKHRNCKIIGEGCMSRWRVSGETVECRSMDGKWSKELTAPSTFAGVQFIECPNPDEPIAPPRNPADLTGLPLSHRLPFEFQRANMWLGDYTSIPAVMFTATPGVNP